MISWCPMGAVILGGKTMASLDLNREEDQQRFGEVLVQNECACPKCFRPYACKLESIKFARVVGRIRCTQCGFRFRWYASEATFLVWDFLETSVFKWHTSRDSDEPGAATQAWQELLTSEFDEPKERDTPLRGLLEFIAELRCPICREDLFHPIRYRTGLVRVVCRNAGCRQQWGFNPEQASDNGSTELVAA